MQSATLKSCKASASLILVAQTAPSVTKAKNYNYNLLAVQRSKNSGVLPDSYVFPGGNFDKADGSRDWLKLYHSFGFTKDVFEKLKTQNTYDPTFTDTESSLMPKYISLRITAIRETFEECGVLLCRHHTTNYEDLEPHWANFINSKNIVKWRENVIKDPLQFYQLCSEFKMYPDIWSLKEWSNWVTPAVMARRFDTVFFLAALQQVPSTSADGKEIQQIEWTTPTEYIIQNRKSTIFLPPPQFYEISRLQNFLNISILINFAGNREIYGTERYLANKVCIGDKVYTILPGDDLYPDETVLNLEELICLKHIPESKIQNRIEHSLDNSAWIRTKNYIPLYNHVAPFPGNKL